MSATRIRAIFRKELRDYRRNRQIVTSMAVLPLILSVYPSIQILALPASSAGVLLGKQPLVYMLALPAIVPAVVAAYAVAGERQQDTLEPVLTTPIRREELVLGKALAALLPSLAVSYGVLKSFAV
jgi:ABC-2 type transport system permease protein